MLYQLVSKLGNRFDWNFHGAHQPVRLMMANGTLTARKLTAAPRIMRRGILPVSRRRASIRAGRISPGKTFAAAPKPSHTPVDPSARRLKANKPAHIRNTASGSQL